MKTITQYICQNCGSSSRKWAGRCDACNEWNTMQEEISEFSSAKQAKNLNAKKLDFLKLNDEIKENIRINTGINELDRVLGGGLVESSAILIGGDPGIGKSTLLLQLSSSLSLNGMKTAYVTGEESTQQVNLRAKRLKAENSPVNLLAATNIHEIITSIKKLGDVNVVIIDSIQTMFAPEFSSAPGTVSQVRACAHELIKFAKNNQTAIILVGHVTKDGQIAGPKVLEHMVDTVLYFEGDRNNYFRILRSVKNRFGGINEIGVFEMGSLGLLEVTNPSALFLNDTQKSVSGSVVFAGIEGTRPILSEIQSLVTNTTQPMPRRAVVGWDLNRLAMILAVLSARYGKFFGDKEVYLNVAGGLKITEPSADLAVASAILSSVYNEPLPEKTVIFGEIGLSGEIRQVSMVEARVQEAAKLGFEHVILPVNSKIEQKNVKLSEIGHIKQLKSFFD